jgi:hypothetical protein
MGCLGAVAQSIEPQHTTSALEAVTGVRHWLRAPAEGRQKSAALLTETATALRGDMKRQSRMELSEAKAMDRRHAIYAQTLALRSCSRSRPLLHSCSLSSLSHRMALVTPTEMAPCDPSM